MTAEDFKTTVNRHRPAALIGGIAGAGILIGYVVYYFAMIPPTPDLKTAPPAEVVAYVGNERGLDRLPQIEQQNFMLRWRDVLLEDAGKKDALRACLETLPDEPRKAFSEAIFKHLKRAFLDDAKLFSQTPKEQQYAFLQKRIIEGREQILFIKDVTIGLKNTLPGSQDEFQKWLLEHTTPEERAWGEPYYNALKRVRVQVEKEERTSQPAGGEVDKP